MPSPTSSRSAATRCYVSSQYFVGDESNQFPQLPSYAVFNLHASYQITKNVQIYARAEQHLRQSATRPMERSSTPARCPTFANGGAPFTDPRSLSPAQPRAFYTGMKVTF